MVKLAFVEVIDDATIEGDDNPVDTIILSEFKLVILALGEVKSFIVVFPIIFEENCTSPLKLVFELNVESPDTVNAPAKISSDVIDVEAIEIAAIEVAVNMPVVISVEDKYGSDAIPVTLMSELKPTFEENVETPLTFNVTEEISSDVIDVEAIEVAVNIPVVISVEDISWSCVNPETFIPELKLTSEVNVESPDAVNVPVEIVSDVIDVEAIEVAVKDWFTCISFAVSVDTPNWDNWELKVTLDWNDTWPVTPRSPLITAEPNISSLDDGFVWPIAIFTSVASPILPLESTKSWFANFDRSRFPAISATYPYNLFISMWSF